MLLVIIPAYNEAETIGAVLSKIDKKIDVLVVNDGSVDQTSKISKYYVYYMCWDYCWINFGSNLRIYIIFNNLSDKWSCRIFPFFTHA